MTYIQAIIFGVVQGVAEYLPISSSAHLILLPQFMGWKDPGLAFDVFLHLGTLASTLIYFWKDWVEMGRTVVKRRRPLIQETVAWERVFMATIPALVAGAALHSWVETVFRGPWVMVATLTFGGVILYGVDQWVRGMKSLQELRSTPALWIGVAQCFALVPGVSRSGATMIGGRLVGLSRASAARFSFLISAPVVAAALVFELRNFDEILAATDSWGVLLAGGVSSFLSGVLAIKGLLALLRRMSFAGFAIYRIALAAAVWWVLC